MPSFVYVLGCRTPDRILTYVGWTTDVPRRLKQHNGGKGARTTRGRVWILLHTEKFRTRRAGDEPRVVFEARPEISEGFGPPDLGTRRHGWPSLLSLDLDLFVFGERAPQ